MFTISSPTHPHSQASAPRMTARPTSLRASAATLLALLFPLAGCIETVDAPDDVVHDGHSHDSLAEEEAFVTAEQAMVDCSERTDTGYTSGNAFTITVVTVDGKPVERETANAYWVMKEAAARDGVDIRVVSGFRTNAEQQYLYNCYVNCNCNNCNLAARPGYSNHQSGHALDLNTSSGGVLSWLNAHGASFGFSRTVPSEDWHWEWWGGGPGGGPCSGQPCKVIEAGGDTLDDAGPCFQAFGPSQYWRQVNGEGQGGGLKWTNAFASANPSNWGRWNLHFAQGGRYAVEVNTGGTWGVWERTRYTVRHAGADETLTIDQSAVDGWQALGVFDFAQGGEQHVDVYDNYSGTIPADQHIMADAVRVTPWSEPQPDPDPDPDPMPDPDPVPDPEPDPDPEPQPDPTPEPDPDPTPEPQPDPDPDSTGDGTNGGNDIKDVEDSHVDEGTPDEGAALQRSSAPVTSSCSTTTSHAGTGVAPGLALLILGLGLGLARRR